MKRRLKFVVMALFGLLAAAILAGWILIRIFIGPHHAAEGGLPVFKTDQTNSTHAGYRRTTLTSGDAVYVNDYEEYALQLMNSDSTQALGRMEYGDGKVCAIPGQKPEAYVAGDVGSEMPAYAVFRNSRQPPFVWTNANFQSMRFAWPNGSGVNKSTTDAALIADVIRAFREGSSASNMADIHTLRNLARIQLSSEQLPGLFFCPVVYLDPAGPVYLSESMAIEMSGKTPQVHARWIPASPQFSDWVKAP